MKFFLLIVLFCLFVLIAIAVYMFFSVRSKLFDDCVFLTKYLKNNISFNKNNLNILLTNAFAEIKPSSRYILKNNSNSYSKFILKDNKSLLNDFFKSMGHGDVSFELHNLDYYANIFETLNKKSKDELKSKGQVYFKLIIGLGLIVCILLI